MSPSPAPSPQGNIMTPQGFERALLEQNDACAKAREITEGTAERGWADHTGSNDAVVAEAVQRIRTERIQRADIVHPVEQSERVLLGTTVVVETEDEARRTFIIGGSNDSNREAGLVTCQSPVARALLGKEVDDSAVLPQLGEVAVVEIRPPSQGYEQIAAQLLKRARQTAARLTAEASS